jgi:hypothetical protein
MNPARALIWLTGSLIARALREGLVVRALSWPGLLTALTLVVSAGGVGVFYASDSMAVGSEELADELRREGLNVVVVSDPQASYLAGEVDRAAWQEDGAWQLHTRFGGRLSLLAEGVLRDRAGAPWMIEVPPMAARDARMAPMTRLLVGLLAVLFALYGVVFGAGALMRDREDGTLEAERALPVPGWLHPAARVIAAGGILGVGLVLSVGLLHGLMEVDLAAGWAIAGSAAAWSGVALGLGLMDRSGESLSGPLARGMAASTGLMVLGLSLPELGRHLPMASLGALAKGVPPSAGAWLVALMLTVAVCWRAGRSR